MGAPAAAAALADALLDAELRRAGVSLSERLADMTGQSPRPTVPWCAVLADVSLDPVTAVQRGELALDQGASSLKLKLADPVAFRPVLGALRRAVEVPIAADANGVLDFEEAVALDDLGLAYLEQPLAPGTPWEELARLRGAIGTRLALDESLVSLDALQDALRAGALGAASIKPARIGGCAAAARAVALCHKFGADCFVGGMFELGTGRAAALAVAALDWCNLETDLGPSARYVDPDLCEPLVTVGAGGEVSGHMVVPDGPGIGRVPDDEVVDRYLVARLTIGDAGLR